MDVNYRKHILNWVSTFPEITGVYLIISNERKTKQVQSADFLFSAMTFCRDLREADFDLIVAYMNTESLLFSLLDKVTITMGSFENTRIFSIDKFLASDDGQRGPKARMYLGGLFNWVQYNQAKEIKEAFPDIWAGIYSATAEGDAALSALVEPAFNQSPLYKHYFQVFYQQVKALDPLTCNERYTALRAWIKQAKMNYELIEEGGFDFERHGAGDHLDAWLQAINRYYREYLR